VKRQPEVLAASFGIAFFLIPLYPAFIRLTGAAVPGISLVPRSLTIALLVLVAAIVAYWSLLLSTMPWRPMPTLPPVAALPAAGFLSALLGFDPLAGAVFIAILVFGVVAHAAILRFARLPSVIPSILTAYLLSGICASVLAIIMVYARQPPALYTIGHGRAIGTFVLPGELAGYLIVFVPVALALTQAKKLQLEALAWPALVLGAIAFVMTFSRAGWLGMAAALAVFALLYRRGHGGTRLAVGIACAAVLMLVLSFNAHHDPSENFTRPSIWAGALQVTALFPLIGVGPFEFARVYPLVRLPGGELLAFHAHSVLLTIAAETGLVGLAALVFGWWRFAVELRARMRLDATYGIVALGIVAGLAGTWVQGLIDTVSVVIFGLWLPFMALALVCAGHDRPAQQGVLTATFATTLRTHRAMVAAIGAFALLAAGLQFASDALFSDFAAPHSVLRRLPERLGVRIYDVLTRVVPLPSVDLYLVKDALIRHDFPAAERYATRIPAGALRSEIRARVAMAEGDEEKAFQLFLEAGDDEALQTFVAERASLIGEGWNIFVVPSLRGGTLLDARRRGLRDAHRLEARIRDRLAAAGTRPNALADSWWRLGVFAEQLGDVREAGDDYAHATAIAPLNTKYLKAAGDLALRRHDWSTAAARFSRAFEIDPTDEGAYRHAADARQNQSLKLP
jgi:O-antigen ligase/tetratricopeptide (TPR) repeat protein